MIEILRVLADGTGTSPSRSAVAPVARSFRYQLAWKSAASHSSLRRFTRSRIDWLLSFPSAPYLGPAPHERAQLEPRNGAVDGLTAAPAHGRVAQHGDRADPLRSGRRPSCSGAFRTRSESMAVPSSPARLASTSARGRLSSGV